MSFGGSWKNPGFSLNLVCRISVQSGRPEHDSTSSRTSSYTYNETVACLQIHPTEAKSHDDILGNSQRHTNSWMLGEGIPLGHQSPGPFYSFTRPDVTCDMCGIFPATLAQPRQEMNHNSKHSEYHFLFYACHLLNELGENVPTPGLILSTSECEQEKNPLKNQLFPLI